MVLRASKASRASVVTRARMEPMASMARLAREAHVATLASLVHVVHVVLRAPLVLGSQGLQVGLDPVDCLESRDLLAEGVQMVAMARGEHLARTAKMAKMASTARTASLVRRGLLVSKEKRDLRVTAANLSCKCISTPLKVMST